ncbi:MucBP domain-containing protein, partial [Lactobacillus sp. AN1001]
EAKKGSVDVTYVTEDGKVLEPTSPVAENEEVGTDYTTVQKDFDGYHFVGMDKKSDPAVGLVSEGTKHVIYVYAKNPEAKKGSVDVTYVTEDGKVLEPTSFVAENQDLGTSYATTQKSFDGYHFVRMGDFSATTTGTVEEGIKHVVYVYAKNPEIKKGSVDVTYVTEDGKVLEPTSFVAENQDLGTSYATTQKDFDGYHFVRMGDFSATTTGTVEEGIKHVVYVYAKNPEIKKGSVDVTYVTEDGKVLEPTSPVAENEEVGTDYTTVQKDFDGYHFVGMDKKSDPAVGLISEGTKHVIYVYAKNPEAKKGSVDVTYVTEDGKVLEPTSPVAENEEVGTDYTTVQKDFDGYHFVGMDKKSDPAVGLISEGTKHVIYVYAKNPEAKKGSVDVTYVTEDGKVLEPTSPVAENEEVGTDYTTVQKDFDGYHFVGMDKKSDPAVGLVSEGTKHVIYVYAKNPEAKKGSVDVTYVTEDGKVLEPTSFVAENQDLGTSYATTQKSFDGYHFVRMGDFSATTTGTVEEGIKHVVYVYAKNPEVKQGNVIVKYVDENGNMIAEDVEDTPTSDVDTDYDTTDHKPHIIEKDGKRYIFTKVKDGDNEAGKVTEGTTTVTYVYKELGGYIPYIPGNPGDPYDPTNPGTDEPKVPYDDTPEEPNDNPPLPYIPGYTPKDPNGDPLKPVDPNDPTKGYVPPSITDPKDPGKDTPVPYEKNEDLEPEKPTTPPQKDQPTRDSENPGEPSKDNGQPKATSTANNNTNTSNAETTTLPQTGDKDENNLASLGILSLLAGGLGVFAGRKKRKKTDK